MSMRILYLSQYFPPEVGATQSRAFDMAQCWKNLGHRVTILTEFPNHPSGKIPPKYRRKILERDVLEGLEVYRVWVKTSPVKNFRIRMFFYLSYMVNAIAVGLLLIRSKFDFIYATSPPLSVGAAALVLSLLKRTPMVFEVRDLWPESAIALGELSNKLVIQIATRLEEWCYQKSIRIVVVTQGVYTHLLKRGLPPEKLTIIPNGANTELFTFDQIEREQIRKIHGVDEKFVAIYAGILGLAQGLETVIEAARLLEGNTDIHFLFIGDGPKKPELEQLANSYNLTNLTFLPEKPRAKIPGYLSASDVALIPLRNAEVFKGVVPSKLFDAWACERPVILCIDGEARELVEREKGGIFVSPENPAQIVETIQRMKKYPDELHSMGKNGHEYTVRYHSRRLLAEKLIIELQSKIAIKTRN